LDKVRKGAVLIKGDIKTEVEKIKKKKGKDIWLFGGAELISLLMNLQLVDEIILGRYIPLFLEAEKLY
jgi:dihydrofolate reductase